MHIALDLRMVGPQLHGIARYAAELSRRLPRLAPGSRFDLIVTRELNPKALGELSPNVQLVEAKSDFLSPAEQVELPLLLGKLRPDLYHSPSFSVPVAYRGPLALTIHDANHLVFPEHYGHFHGYYYRHIVRPGAMRARLLLTVSHFARTEIEKRLKVPPGRVQVVYNGVDPSFRPLPREQVEAFRDRLGLPRRFVLYVGNSKPHKNVRQLVEAFGLLGGDLGLVLCAGKRAEQLLPLAGRNAGRVRVLDGINDEGLPLLYNAASAFAFPSLYEGFGLPPLEAMACGVPAVVTRASSLPEVLGEAATFVEPGDARGLARALEQALEDGPALEARRAAGLERAARFSWDRTASEILDSYRCATEAFAPRGARAVVPGPRGPRRKVLFCVRQNLWSLPGGDATQILRTREMLEELGVAVSLWTEPHPPAHGSYDLAHLFHLTRLDTYVQATALSRERMPFVLSTIYWPTTEFERRGYIGALRLLHSSLSEGLADVTKNGIRAVLADGEWRWVMLPGAAVPLEQRIRWLVEHALCLLPNSRAEGDVLRGFGAREIFPIVNAADPPPERPVAPTHRLPERYVLCAGRIEPRKNQLALVEALADFHTPLVLVGDPGP
ncbi:MAG: glycosyltransferase, partial [Myxococcales bacterium]